MRNIFLVIAILLVVAGCSGNKALRHRLEQAEALMDSRPDSSLILLDSINPDMLGSDENRAFYALLYSQARDKNYIDVTDDSLISVATRYYTTSSDTRRAMLSFYYKACVLFNASDYSHAIISALEAEKLARQLDDKIFVARCNEVISDIYKATYNYREELSSRANIPDLYKELGRKKEYYYSLMNLARAYSDNNQFDRSIGLLDSIGTAVNATNDSSMISYLIKSYILAYLYRSDDKDIIKAKFQYKELEKYGYHYTYNNFDYSNMACILLKENKIDSAMNIIDIAIENIDDSKNDMSIKNASYLLAKARGNMEEALRIHEEMFSMDDSLTRTILSQNAVLAQKDYYKRETIRQNVRYNNMKIYLIFSIIIMLLLIVGVWFIYRERLKRKDIEIENKINEIQVQRQSIISLSEKIGGQEKHASQLSVLVGKLFAERFSTLNILCNEFFEKRDSDKVKYSIYERVKTEIIKFSEPKEVSKLEKIVDQCKDDIVKKLREEFPNMTEREVTFLVMIFAGLSPRAISLFMDMKLGNYYNKRQRLKTKIAASDSKYKRLFLSNIDK